MFNDFISLIFPDYCSGCMEGLVKGEDFLCTTCRAGLPKTNYHLDPENPLSKRIYNGYPLKYSFAYLFFIKKGIVQKLLHQLKYNNQPQIGEKLGNWYAKDLLDQEYQKEFDLIVPVPLHKKRLKQRGYNQSDHFAKGLSEILEVKWNKDILVRETHSESQTRKNRLQRFGNVENIFKPIDKDVLKDKRVLVVDDVITTGATALSCAVELLESGCLEVSIASVAIAIE